MKFHIIYVNIEPTASLVKEIKVSQIEWIIPQAPMGNLKIILEKMINQISMASQERTNIES